MKLFCIYFSWRFKRMKKRRGVIGYAIAENEKEALEKFKKIIAIPSEAIEIDYSVYEKQSGVTVAHYR